MSIHLIGGGRDAERVARLLRAFVSDVRDAAGQAEPVFAVLVVLEPGDDAGRERFRGLLLDAGAAPAQVRVEAIAEGERFAPSAVDGAHGLFVGGGLTPAYLDAFSGIRETVRERVARGVPYAGFSAGAAIAAVRAVVGGFRLDGVDVSPEDAGEELDEVEVRDGLGLVPFSVDVHAAQWGTLARLIAVVSAGHAPAGVAIDEHTVVVVDQSGASEIGVHGHGHAWHVEPADAGAHVRAATAVPLPGEPSIPLLEVDETVAPRPEEEIADVLRAEPDATGRASA